MSSTLSQPALDIIHKYLHLPIGDKFVSCPYYNNRRQKVRGALRVLVGKGSPDDITEEAMIMSMREKIPLGLLSEQQLKEFLVNHGLGIDCSAFAYYVLNAELLARKKKTLGSVLQFPPTLNLLRIILRTFRKVENTDVSTFTNERNSHTIAIEDVQAGDMITMLDTGQDASRNHIVIIHEVETNTKNIPTVIHYTHSLEWRTDGKYQHGVRHGKIVLTHPKKSLVDQQWIEQDKEGKENETLERATSARILELRRLHAFSS